MKLYNDNSITAKLKDIDEISLIGIKEDEVYLFSRNFLGFEIKELEKSEFNYDNIISKQNKANKHNFYVIVLNSIVLLLFIIFVFLLFGCFKNIGPGWCNLDGEKLSLFVFILFVLSFFISPFANLVFFIIILICSKTIKSILNVKGGDEFTIELVKILNKDPLSTNIIYSIIIIIIIAIIIIIFILIIILFFMEKMEKIKKKTNFIQNAQLFGAYLLGKTLTKIENDSNYEKTNNNINYHEGLNDDDDDYKESVNSVNY